MGGAKSKTGTMAEEDLTAQLDAAGLSDDSDANEDNPPSHQDSVTMLLAPDSPLSSVSRTKQVWDSEHGK